MDPNLRELILSGEPQDDVEAIMRLTDAKVLPDDVRIISQFGEIATCRLPRHSISKVWADVAVASLKASRNFGLEPEPETEEADSDLEELDYVRRPDVEATGKGVVLGIIDWGFDFTHPNFLDTDGKSRFLALWDQSEKDVGYGKFNYGRVHFQEQMNEALIAETPFDYLGYQPAKGDPIGNGAHGTHVLDIAAGNGNVGQKGVAPNADIVAVHLSSGNLGGLASLGDSVRILEAIDFISEIAGNRPLVINMSVGKHGGCHSGRSLVEQGMDMFLKEKKGRAIVQSTGNYYQSNTHSSGRLNPGATKTFVWQVDKADRTPNELEVWYEGNDVFGINLSHPQNGIVVQTNLGEHKDIIYEDELIGRLYHRKNEPNTKKNHIDIFLYPNAPYGEWEVELSGKDVVNGKYHAWIERDTTCRGCQSKFVKEDADNRYTTGTICNGLHTVAVGAINPYNRNTIEMAPFSSSGPTTDFRKKPSLVAPGVMIKAARSTSMFAPRSSGELTVKSGTSMAAPHVAGAIALAFEVADVALPIEHTRRLMLGNVLSLSDLDINRTGYGLLNIESLLIATQDESSSFKEHDINLFRKQEDFVTDFAFNNFEEKNNIMRHNSNQGIKHPRLSRKEIKDLFIKRKDLDQRSPYKVVAFPNQKLNIPLQKDDILVRFALGEDRAMESTITSGVLANQSHYASQAMENNSSGYYAEVEDMGRSRQQHVARRIRMCLQ